MTEKKTVRVRIAVAMNPYGHWCVAGREWMDDAQKVQCIGAAGSTITWVEADIPIPPEPPVIEGEVKP